MLNTWRKIMGVIILLAISICSCDSPYSYIKDDDASNEVCADHRNVKQRELINDTEIIFRDSVLQKYNGIRNFTYNVVLENSPFSVELKTYCVNDTLADDLQINEGIFSLATRPLIVHQELLFKNGERILRTYDLPFTKVSRTNYKGKKLESLEMDVWLVYLIKGVKEDIIGISATGLCAVSQCPEFTGYYSQNGDILYEGSTSSYNGTDVDSMFLKYGVSDSSLHEWRKNGIRTDVFWQGSK